MSTIEAIETKDVRFIRDSITRPANTTQYAAGDAVSEVTTNDYFTFSKICKPSNYRSLIEGAILYSSSNESTKLAADLFLFASNNAPSETADNSAWAPSDAEVLTCIGVISFAANAWTEAGANSAFCELDDLRRLIAPGTADIVGQLVARNTYTPVSGEILTIELKVVRY